MFSQDTECLFKFSDDYNYFENNSLFLFKNLFKTMKLLFFISLIFLFAACKKEKTSSVSAPSYNITKVTRVGKSINLSYTLSYDSSGRIAKIICDGQDAFVKTFSYNGDTIFIKSDLPKVENSYMVTITLNSFNLMSTNRKVTNQQSVYNASYNYDGSGHLLSLNAQQNTYTYPVITYTTTNGDVTNTTSQGVTDTTTYFSDKASIIGNLDDLFQVIDYGAPYYRNKHLKKSYQSGKNRIDYSYSFDSEGKIISVVSNYNFGDNTDTTNITYTKR